jgi:coenzyme F420-dependent glucose-6-phosphate dehydrogenase
MTLHVNDWFRRLAHGVSQLFSRPPSAPPVIGAAITADSAEWMRGWADGLITVGASHAALRTNIDAFHRGGARESGSFCNPPLAWARPMIQRYRLRMSGGATPHWTHSTLRILRRQIAPRSPSR